MPSRALTLAALVACLPALAACSAPREETVPYTQPSATLAVGETLVVDLGEINPSVGDAWELTTEPDADVLAAGEQESDSESDAPGSPSHLVHRFEATGAGTTTIGFTYSYRGTEGDPEGRTEDPTPEITVTVTG